LGKAFHAAAKYLYAGLEETGIDDTDFRVLEVLLNKGPLPVNTIGPKVHLTPGSISTAVDLSLPIIPSESSKAAARGTRRIQINLYVLMLFDRGARTSVTAPQSGVLRQV